MKAIIYLRTSIVEQFPDKQKNDCLLFAKNRGYEVVEIFEEKLSGYKNIVRPMYDEVKRRAFKGEIQAVIVWALDRWVRNRETLIEDVATLRSYGVKLHSVNEQWLETINIEGPLGKTIQEFLLGIIGSLSQMESMRKSERMKMAFINRKGRWGRKKLSKLTQERIMKLFNNGVSLRQISKQVTYSDRNGHPKLASLGVVHKIVHQHQYLS